MHRFRNRMLGRVTAGHVDNYLYGIYYTGTNYAFDGLAQTGLEQCDDWTQPPPYDTDQNLILTKQMVIPLRINGSYQPDYFRYVYVDWNPISRTSYVYCPATTELNLGGLVNKALANLNPNKPILDLPLFLFEFKDFPEMLRDLGRVLQRKIHPSSIPNGYLAYSFGWRPLYQDLKSLFDLSKSLDQRLRELTAAKNEPRGVRIRRSLGESSSRTIDGDINVAYDGTAYSFSATAISNVKTKAWMTARMRVTSDLPPPQDLPRFVVENGLGANVSMSTLWEMVPWSWLIDYFASIGDMLAALRGFIHWEVPHMCIMQRSEAISKLENVRTRNGFSSNASEHVMMSVSKRRSVYVNPLPSISPTPFLTDGHLANLGALILARALKERS